jgi:DNA-binding beta-propeller fold protein YncE
MTYRNRTNPGIRCTLVLFVFIGVGAFTSAQDKKVSDTAGASKKTAKSKSAHVPAQPFPKRIEVPDLEGGTGWLNTSGPISLRELRGKIVVLDFWTYCCINCMHILPDLAYLEKKYPNELVVIGVHSAKFDNEKDSENIRAAILRYEIKHPVVNDSQLIIWKNFGVNTWPTLAVIDPEGYGGVALSGEGNRENLERAIDRMIAYHKAKGTLDQTPMHFKLESQKAARTPLRFPGKVLADQASNRLFISDSNHNRIVITDLNGKVQDVVGSGAMGKKDGGYAEARFDHPQGMDLSGNLLYVADTENHCIRTLDLDAKVVKTIAGTGKQTRDRTPHGPAIRTSLSSPWDVKKVGDRLFIAMAGPHQIWVIRNDTIQAYAGSGKEDVKNGPLMTSALAQPSGITTDGRHLFVVDSEGSAVRQIPLKPGEAVTTLVGTSDLPGGRCLFEFADIDGIGDKARLQHPIGIAYRDGKLYVADTYNHKIKIVDIAKKSSMTFLGTGKSGSGTDPVQLSEPAGLSFAGNKLYIADTNNHQIRVVDMKSNKVSTLELKGLEPPEPGPVEEVGPKPKEVKRQSVASGDHLQIDVTLQIPAGFKLNPLQDPWYELKAEGNQTLIAQDQLGRDELKAAEGKISIKLPLSAKSGSAKYQLTVYYTYCNEGGNGGACRLQTSSWIIPVTVADAAEQKTIELVAEVSQNQG